VFPAPLDWGRLICKLRRDMEAGDILLRRWLKNSWSILMGFFIAQRRVKARREDAYGSWARIWMTVLY
jgi:hypothetical protein